MDIYIHGHGVWEPRGGYITVPRGFKISFYTHFAKTVSGSTVDRIFDGGNVPPERTIEEFKTVPNFVVSGLTADQKRHADQKKGDLQVLMPQNEMELRTIFLGFGPLMVRVQKSNAERRVKNLSAAFIHLHWLCCQRVLLEPTWGNAVGVNAQDMRHNEQHEGTYRVKWDGVDHYITIPGHHT